MRVLLTILFFLTYISSYAGGGWVKEKNKGYYKFSQAWVSSEGYFSGANGYSPDLNSNLLTTSFYMEQGLGQGVSLEVYLPFYIRHSVEGIITEEGNALVVDDAAGGLGDADIGLRFQLYKSDLLNISGTARLGLPLGGTGKGERQNLFTGDGEFNQLLRLDASVPFGVKKVGGFANTYIGYNNRKTPFSNELHYGVEAGLSAADSRLWLIGRVIGIHAGDDEPQEFSNGFTQSMSYTNYMIEAVFYLADRYGFSVSYTGSLSGNVVLTAPQYSAGLFMDI